MSDQNEVRDIIPQDHAPVDVETLRDNFTAIWTEIQNLPEGQAVQTSAVLVTIFEQMSALEVQTNHYFTLLQTAAQLFADMRLQRDIALDDLEHLRKHQVERGRQEIVSNMTIMNDLTPTEAKRFLEALIGETPGPLSAWTRTQLIDKIKEVAGEVFELEVDYGDYLADIDFEEIDHD